MTQALEKAVQLANNIDTDTDTDLNISLSNTLTYLIKKTDGYSTLSLVEIMTNLNRISRKFQNHFDFQKLVDELNIEIVGH